MSENRYGKFVFLVLLLISCTGCGGLLDDLKKESQDVERDARAEERREQLHGLRRSPAGTSANNMRSYADRDDSAFGGALRDRGSDAYSRYKEYADQDREVNLPRRRYTRKDFQDAADSTSSLWNPTGQTNYYFSQNQRFDPGDLVIVEVERGLRREIQYRLWQSLPAELRKIKRRKKPSDGKEGEDKGAPEEEAARTVASVREQVEEQKEELDKLNGRSLSKDGEDILRMEVIENMGNGLVRLVGQKRVIYRGRPMFVEVSSLIRSKNIDKNSRAKSSQFLDQRARVTQ